MGTTVPGTIPPPRKVLKRACDGCKVRKIKCSEVAPCNGCVVVGIECTFRKRQDRRGPRSLRAKTFLNISKTQGNNRDGNENGDGDASGNGDGVESSPVGRESEIPRSPLESLEEEQFIGGEKFGERMSEKTPNRTPLNSLVLRLCVYRLRLYPVWPIVAVEEIMASLQSSSDDMETYALANAIGAATIAQLKLSRSESDSAAGNAMEAECQRARGVMGQKANLNALRTAFFLHVYHENQEPGGIKSLLYLREAITLAQVMGLHRESSFGGLQAGEQQVRRRVLWLLFVTERGVAMLHKLPVVLKPNTNFPSLEGDDEANIMPAFLKLINLFRIFDQSGAFDILQNSDTDTFNVGDLASASHISLQLLRRKLQEVSIDWGSSNDVQTADICVTRQWMQAVLWKVSMRTGTGGSAEDQITSLSHPIQIAKEFLSVIEQLPGAAIEAHGPSMEYKIFEIASAVTDALLDATSPLLPITYYNSEEQPQNILDQLQRLLASSRGGNSMLAALLKSKMNGIGLLNRVVEQSSRVEELDDQWLSESTTSPDQVGLKFSMEGTLGPPLLSSPKLQMVMRGEEPTGRGAPEQQASWPDFMAQPWNFPAEDLYEQLQSFNGLDSGPLDRLFAGTGAWDGGEGDANGNAFSSGQRNAFP